MRIVIIDDHPLYREGLAGVLRIVFPGADIAEAQDLSEGLQAIHSGIPCDLVLLDLILPGGDGLAAIPLLRKENPSLTIVIVSASEDLQDVQRCVAAGAAGFIPKSARKELLGAALSLVRAGGVYFPRMPAAASTVEGEPVHSDMDCVPDGKDMGCARLTRREIEVLALVCAGEPNKSIARQLGISDATVRTHLSSIFKTLAVVNRTQASLAARRLGIIAIR